MLEVRLLRPSEIRRKTSTIAALRINVFKDFPYIYDGSIEYEVKYLGRYLESPSAQFLGAFHHEELAGVATSLPLSEEDDFVKKTFQKNGSNFEDIFYFGESVLLPAYRGQGVGHRFFDLRETATRAYGSKMTAFCAIQREPHHPRKPQNYRPLDDI